VLNLLGLLETTCNRFVTRDPNPTHAGLWADPGVVEVGELADVVATKLPD
jgi:hypothetical protein